MKTYCISDIHGHWNNFEAFIDTLNKEDRVYVLGDVIDKGPASIKCLQHIMADARFSMLLGNHEYMMFQTICYEPGTRQQYDAEIRWLYFNAGNDTLNQYNLLAYEEKEKIMRFIIDLPINIPNIKIEDRSYYLVHSYPHSDKQINMEDVNYDDDIITSYLWDRTGPADRFDVEDQIVVAGHTFVQEYLGIYVDEVRPVPDFSENNKELKKARYIDIDGGLATGLPNSRLIALCLDDLSYKLY